MQAWHEPSPAGGATCSEPKGDSGWADEQPPLLALTVNAPYCYYCYRQYVLLMLVRGHASMQGAPPPPPTYWSMRVMFSGLMPALTMPSVQKPVPPPTSTTCACVCCVRLCVCVCVCVCARVHAHAYARAFACFYLEVWVVQLGHAQRILTHLLVPMGWVHNAACTDVCVCVCVCVECARLCTLKGRSACVT